MTEENHFPNLGEHDWSAMEALANGADEQQIVGGPDTVILTDEMILKRVLWDVAPHSIVPEVSAYLGLTQTSDDGAEMEHDEAHGRIVQAMGVVREVRVLSDVAARAIFATMLVQQEGTETVPLDSEEFTDHVSKFAQVIFAASLSTVAELIDWGSVHAPFVEVVFITNEGEDNNSGE